jgi:outer membrane receptor protein involved in Fe transport
VWFEYTHPREFAGGNFYARYQWSYMGNSLNGIGDDAALQPAYQVADAKIGLSSDEWDVYVYVDNLTNERAVLYDQQSAPPGTVTINWPRTWGLGFSKSWGGN